jgi:pimeloyl-ACP methyl ester carboxylesterase
LVPDPVYYHFVQRLRDATKGRFDRQGLVVDPDASDTVITFNYDVMLDFAMHFNATPAKYYLPGETGGHMPLLKLHGSVNWLECSSCKHSVQVATPSPGSWLGPGEVDDSDSEAFQMYLDMIPTMDCTGCGVRGTLDPLIVPPTWSKRIERDNFARVWRRAVQVLGDAHQIVVVGYSMPSTDTFFQYLMGMALQENSRLRRVVLVDPEADSQAYRDRYASVFGQRLRDRNMVRLSVSFLQFVERSLEAVSVGG